MIERIKDFKIKKKKIKTKQKKKENDWNIITKTSFSGQKKKIGSFRCCLQEVHLNIGIKEKLKRYNKLYLI